MFTTEQQKNERSEAEGFDMVDDSEEAKKERDEIDAKRCFVHVLLMFVLLFNCTLKCLTCFNYEGDHDTKKRTER